MWSTLVSTLTFFLSFHSTVSWLIRNGQFIWHENYRVQQEDNGNGRTSWNTLNTNKILPLYNIIMYFLIYIYEWKLLSELEIFGTIEILVGFGIATQYFSTCHRWFIRESHFWLTCAKQRTFFSYEGKKQEEQVMNGLSKYVIGLILHSFIQRRHCLTDVCIFLCRVTQTRF
jgi:hypothetical protein